MEASSAELRRIERDLHDGAQARMVAVAMELGMAEERLARDPEGAREMVRGARDETRRALAEMRDLVRGIAPSVLADRGLEAAIGSIAARALKDRVAEPAEFVRACERVAAGGTALDPEVVAQLMVRGRRDEGPISRLTPRERETLALMAEGRSNRGIAEALVVTEGAVEKHVTSILGKLDLPNAPGDHRRVLAVLALLRAGDPA